MNEHTAIITSVYQNYNILADFFDSLNKQTSRDFIVFLTDVSKNKKEINAPSYCTVLHSRNKGYAHAINTGITEAITQGYTSYFVMNSDVILDQHFVERAKNSLDTHQQSIIGGKIYYAPGFEYHKDRYSSDQIGKVLWYAGGKNDWNNVLTPHRGVDEVDTGQYDIFEETDFITGCLMIFDKKVIDKIGYWDESYFMYFEDSDYCERAKRQDIPLYYDPQIIMYHKNAQSTGGAGSKTHFRTQLFSQLKFAFRYAPLRTKLHVLKNFAVSFLTKHR